MHIDNLNQLYAIAKEAAIEASKAIQYHFNRDIEIKEKDGTSAANSIVTQSDIDSQKAILEILEPTRLKYDLGLITEEETCDNSRFEKDYFWCIDPLDGTLNFSQKKEGYSISIALVSKAGIPILGLVLNPATNDIYHAIKGHGAFKNDKKLQIKSNSKDVSIIEGQGAVMNAINTIEMAPAIYYKLPKKTKGGGSTWDYAATSIIQSEAGGFNSDYGMKRLNLNKQNTFMNEYGIIYVSSIDLLEKHLPKG
jgi:3'(2'), 5'-bisphosphate nucleotidase